MNLTEAREKVEALTGYSRDAVGVFDDNETWVRKSDVLAILGEEAPECDCLCHQDNTYEEGTLDCSCGQCKHETVHRHGKAFGGLPWCLKCAAEVDERKGQRRVKIQRYYDDIL